jgi:catechol 2,3-dioxygenase-like lactoylglutathione lyase family enzyme
MYSHMMVGANDMDAAKKFYDAIFSASGGQAGRLDPTNRLIYMNKGGLFLVTKPIDGEAATHGNGSTIGFAMDSTEQADAWHAAGVANGGTAIEEAPGWREGSFGRLYLAYLRDPAGNKLCAMLRG